MKGKSESWIRFWLALGYCRLRMRRRTSIFLLRRWERCTLNRIGRLPRLPVVLVFLSAVILLFTPRLYEESRHPRSEAMLAASLPVQMCLAPRFGEPEAFEESSSIGGEL